MHRRIIFALGLLSTFQAQAQQNVYNRSESGTGDWGSSNNPWHYANDNASRGDPDNDRTIRNDVFIGHNQNTAMSLNGRFYIARDLTFQSGASDQRIISFTPNGGFSFSRSLANAAPVTHVFNAPVAVDGNNAQIEVTELTGGFEFNSTVFTNGHTVEFLGLGTITVAGQITQAGAIKKSGSGILTLSGENHYSGVTTIDAGKLFVNGDNSAATGAVTVKSGATLGGKGTVGGATTIETNGRHSAGEIGAIGTQTFNSTLTYTAGSIFEWQLNAGAPANGTTPDQGAYDKVNATGAVTGTAVFEIVLGTNNFSDAFWNSDKSWTDIFTTGSGSNTLESIFTSFGGANVSITGLVENRGQFGFIGNTLNWTAVPEPTSALAGLLLAAGLLRRNRRM